MKNELSDILSGRELLRINSQHREVTPRTRALQTTVLTLVYAAAAVATLRQDGSFPPQHRYQSLLIYTILYGILLMVVFSSRDRVRPLIFTECGIAISGYGGSRWEEIVSYRWETFDRTHRVFGPTLFSLGKGNTLRIEENRLLPRWTRRYDVNVLALQLIFFSPEQMAAAETIFSQHGVRKAD